MGLCVFRGHGMDLLGNQTGEPLMQPHAEGTNALRTQADGCCQHQIGTVWLQQVSGADIGLKAVGDERHYVHQGLGRLASTGSQTPDFVQAEYAGSVNCCFDRIHLGLFCSVSANPGLLRRHFPAL